MDDTFETLIQDYAKINEQFHKFQTEYYKQCEKLFKATFVQFFKENPKIVCVTWTQYTPYFNDGEPCVFSTGDKWFLTKEGYEDFKNCGGSYAEEYAAGKPSYYEEKYRKDLTEKDFEIIDKFQQFLFSTADDVYLTLFGDHSYVIATKEGFEVDECSHD